LLFSVAIYSYETEASVYFGAGYDSNLQYINLFEIDPQAEIPQIKSTFLETELDFTANFFEDDLITFEYSLNSNASLNNPEYSLLNHTMSISWNETLNDQTYLTFSAIAHHVMHDYTTLQNLYLDSYLHIYIFHDYSSMLSLYGVLKGGYYDGLIDALDYFKGPAAGVELGTYIYPETGASFFSFNLGVDLFAFREERIIYSKKLPFLNEPHTLDVVNKFWKFYLKPALKLDFTPVNFLISCEYSIIYRMHRDRLSADFIEGDYWEKRRIDHNIEPGLSLLYNLKKSVQLRAYYSLSWNYSNMGREQKDYKDYNYTQHIAGAGVTYLF